MMNHVLTAIDFSASTDRLLARLKMLRDIGVTQATLVHVLSTRYPAAPSETHRDVYMERLGRMADELCASGIGTTTKIVIGEPGYELVHTAGGINADLILAGTSGRQRWREFFLGSTALDLARLTDRPLWLEPMNSSDGDVSQRALHSIVLATDGSDAAESAKEMFVQLIPKSHRAIAVHVVSDDDGGVGEDRETADAKQSLIALKNHAANIEIMIYSGDPTVEISRMAEREDVDLIIVGKRGRSRIRDLLLGSTAEAVCRRSRRPVMLVPSR